MIPRRFLAASAAVLLHACAPATPAPNNWHPIAGVSNAWAFGAGSDVQQYRYAASPFAGSLQDLASQVTIDSLTRYRGAKFKGSLPFPPCPGAAGVQTFELPVHVTVQVAFAVHNGQALRIRYSRPTGTSVNGDASQAMQKTLCTF